MLDKIKVYNRADAQLQDVYNINFVNEEIRLQVNDAVGSVFTLTKNDPLKKFKKEIEGWWFCEEYVVICSNDGLYTVTYHSEKEKFGYIAFQKNYNIENPLSMFEQGKKSVIENINEYNGWSRFFNMELPTIKDLPITYSLLGEDKYLALLELLK